MSRAQDKEKSEYPTGIEPTTLCTPKDSWRAGPYTRFMSDLFKYTVEPRRHEGPRHWQNLLAIPMFRYIEVLFHIFYYYWDKEKRFFILRFHFTCQVWAHRTVLTKHLLIWSMMVLMICEMIWPKDTLRKMRQKRYDSSAWIVSGGRWWDTPYHGLYGYTPPEKGTFFKASAMWNGRDFIIWNIWKGWEICIFGL